MSVKTHSTAGTPMPTLLRRLFLFCNLLVVTGGSLVAATGSASAQTRNGAGNNMGSVPVGIAYFDLDHLYDTIPALFYNDTDYTPEGALKWDSARYNHKIGQVAAVIDSMRMPIVALWSVENEAVVRDIAEKTDRDYNYIHRTANSLDGLEAALLYHADRFIPRRIEAGYGYLSIEGTLDGIATAVLLLKDSRFLPDLLDELARRNKRFIVAGAAERPTEKHLPPLRDPLQESERQGRGTTVVHGRWEMNARILLSPDYNIEKADVLTAPALLDERTHTPRPTYSGRAYLGGASRNLPVFVVFN